PRSDQREEGVVATHLVDEPFGLDFAGGEAVACTGEGVKGEREEDDVAVDGDDGADEVEELDGGDALVEGATVEVTIGGDGVQAGAGGRVDGAGAGIADEGAGPAFAAAARNAAQPVFRANRSGGFDHVADVVECGADALGKADAV